MRCPVLEGSNTIHGTKHNVAIDYADRPDINEGCARSCLLYFKMQFSCDGYGFENVIPGGFIPFNDDISALSAESAAFGRQEIV